MRKRGLAFKRVTFRATFFAVVFAFFVTAVLFFATALFTVALLVEELLFPIEADARFATAPFFGVLTDFVRLLATCRVLPLVADLLLGVAFFGVVLFLTDAFLAELFFAVAFFADAFFTAAVFAEASIGGVTVAGATSTGPTTAGISDAATVLKSFAGVEAASAEFVDTADSDPIDSAAIVSPIAVRRMRRVTSREVRWEWERTGIHLYFL